MTGEKNEQIQQKTAEEWLRAAQAGIEDYDSLRRLTSILTPKGGSTHNELSSEALQELIRLLPQHFSNDELKEWAEHELQSARLALTSDANGEFGRPYMMYTWASGNHVYPEEYRPLFTQYFTEAELKEAEKLFFFYEEMEDWLAVLREARLR